MQAFRLTLLAAALATLLPLTGYAQSVSDLKEMSPEDRRAYMQSMSEDERKAMREKWRAEMDQMTDEERRAFREEMAANRPDRGQRQHAMRERWSSMSDEERAAAREQRAARKQQRRAKWDAMSEEERAAAREKMRDRGGHGKRNRRQHHAPKDNGGSESTE